jgi:ABC-2 type transport system ATP-binding protein
LPTRLRVEEVTVTYRRRRRPAVDGVSVTFGPGRTVLLGPNGAGKSSLLAVAGGALRPNRGGVTADPDAVRLGSRGYARAVGWMPQEVRRIPGFTVQEQVEYHGWLKGYSSQRSRQLSHDALAMVGLTDLAGRRTHELSGGQLRRVGLAQTLVTQPRVVLLDEPTTGLDPAQRMRFRDVMGGLPPEQAVVVSTHLVDDLDELFDRVVVLALGKVRFDGTLPAFLSRGDGRGRSAAESAYSSIVGELDL